MTNEQIADLAKLDTKALLELVIKQKQALEEANKPRAMTMKVSEKGALSIYGLGRFPVTLYAQSWERILDNAVTIRAFIKANPSLSRKS